MLLNDLLQTFSFIVWKRMKQKITIGKCGQKELLFLHGQLILYIFVDMKLRLTVALDKRGFVCVWRAGQ